MYSCGHIALTSDPCLCLHIGLWHPWSLPFLWCALYHVTIFWLLYASCYYSFKRHWLPDSPSDWGAELWVSHTLSPPVCSSLETPAIRLSVSTPGSISQLISGYCWYLFVSFHNSYNHQRKIFPQTSSQPHFVLFSYQHCCVFHNWFVYL